MGRYCWIQDLYKFPLCLLNVIGVGIVVCKDTKKWIDIAGDKSTATKAIVTVYDIFGPSNQTLQGADLVCIHSVHLLSEIPIGRFEL